MSYCRLSPRRESWSPRIRPQPMTNPDPYPSDRLPGGGPPTFDLPLTDPPAPPAPRFPPPTPLPPGGYSQRTWRKWHWAWLSEIFWPQTPPSSPPSVRHFVVVDPPPLPPPLILSRYGRGENILIHNGIPQTDILNSRSQMYINPQCTNWLVWTENMGLEEGDPGEQDRQLRPLLDRLHHD